MRKDKSQYKFVTEESKTRQRENQLRKYGLSGLQNKLKKGYNGDGFNLELETMRDKLMS